MQDLYILPFDHRSAFQKALLGKTQNISSEEHEKIKQAKNVIYDSFKYIVEMGAPSKNLGVLVDEEYGTEVLEHAKKDGFCRILTVEKSGQIEFDFEYGNDFKEHILKFSPEYAKILIRYNPEGDKELNQRQRTKIALLNDFCRSSNIKLLLEVLTVPTDNQLAQTKGDEHVFGQKLRPILLQKTIEEFKQANIIPAVWKLEGLWRKEDYQMLCDTAGKATGIVVLGTGTSKDSANELFSNAEVWLAEGSKVPNVIGFAVGRIVFMQPVKRWSNGELKADQASKLIAENFFHFYKLFAASRQS